ncbi:hypothetical protein ACS127_08600 [Amphibacillus sp. Q70]|uniref:hypothetical protein n=1 Tax=Amphibacillus sp. Q70 TaxID=3453416 RepID=UPI003F85F1FD
MKESIDSRKKTILERFEKESENISDSQSKDEMFEYKYLDDYQSLDQDYTFILRKSLFITLHSFMESELLRISKSLENQNHSQIKLTDIKHSGLKRYLFYIEKVINIDIKLSEMDRKTFIKYSDLRNYFVHNDGIEFQAKQHTKFKSLPYIKFREYRLPEIYEVESLEKEFNVVYLDLISKFFKQLFVSLDEYDIKL